MLHTLEQLRKVLEWVADNGTSFTKPDDDWACVAFLFSRKKIKIIHIMFDRAGKEAVIDNIAVMVKQTKAVSGALVISQWFLAMRTDTPMIDTTFEMLDSMGVRNHPNRKEQVSVELFDGTNEEIWDAEIERYPDRPPTLKPWVKRDWENSTGRMANVLKRAFALAKREKV